MRTGCQLFLVACVAAFSAVADDTLLDESSECVFSADTTGSPYVVKSANEVEVLTYRAGESVTAIAPDGSSLGIVAAGASGGSANWTASGGGVWRLVNSKQGEVRFCVRHSAFGTQGEGTEASPWKIVDAAELSELVADETASAGFVFLLCGDESAPYDIDWPTGYVPSGVDNSAWVLASNADGLLYGSAQTSFKADSMKIGPNRTYEAGDGWMPVAFSGDNWIGAADATATLTFVAPDGTSTAVPCTGCGVYDFEPYLKKHGIWTVTLTPANSAYASLVATLKERVGFVLTIK